MTDASLAIIEHSENQKLILAVWNRRYHCYTLPGGKHEPSDLSSTGAMMREVFEETELTVTISQLIHEDVVNAEGEKPPVINTGLIPVGTIRVFTHWAMRCTDLTDAKIEKRTSNWNVNIPYQLVWIPKRDFLDQTPWPKYTAAAFINLENNKIAA